MPPAGAPPCAGRHAKSAPVDERRLRAQVVRLTANDSLSALLAVPPIPWPLPPPRIAVRAQLALPSPLVSRLSRALLTCVARQVELDAELMIVRPRPAPGRGRERKERGKDRYLREKERGRERERERERENPPVSLLQVWHPDETLSKITNFHSTFQVHFNLVEHVSQPGFGRGETQTRSRQPRSVPAAGPQSEARAGKARRDSHGSFIVG